MSGKVQFTYRCLHEYMQGCLGAQHHLVMHAACCRRVLARVLTGACESWLSPSPGRSLTLMLHVNPLGQMTLLDELLCLPSWLRNEGSAAPCPPQTTTVTYSGGLTTMRAWMYHN